MQPMQQVTKKCSRNRPKGSQNRPQDAQDAAKMASWSPHGRQNASQDGPKTPKKVMFFFFFQVFGAKCSQVPPGRPRQRNLEQKEPPRPPQTPSGPWFYYNFRRFWWHFERIFVMLCFPLFSFALLCFSLLYWINNQSPALSKQCLHTPTTFSKQYIIPTKK